MTLQDLKARDPLVELKITSAVCSLVAIAMTLYRLWIRRCRLWLDDACAAFALLCLLIQIVSVFIHLPIPNSLPQTSRIAAYYLMAYTFYSVIWLSRLSILFSVMRIDPSPLGRRRLSYIAGAFTAAALFLMAQLLWECEPLAKKSSPSWKSQANPQCPLPRAVAICQLVTDVLADATLLFSPLHLLRGLADKGLRRKLGIIFSTCVITTIVSLVHAAYIINRAGIKVLISAIVEDCISLIVANIPVVVAAFISLSTDQDYVDTVQSRSIKFRTYNRERNPSLSYGFTGSTSTESYSRDHGSPTPAHGTRVGTVVTLALETIDERPHYDYDYGQTDLRRSNSLHDSSQTKPTSTTVANRRRQDSEDSFPRTESRITEPHHKGMEHKGNIDSLV